MGVYRISSKVQQNAIDKGFLRLRFSVRATSSDYAKSLAKFADDLRHNIAKKYGIRI